MNSPLTTNRYYYFLWDFLRSSRFTKPREARDLIFKIRSYSARSDSKNKQKTAENTLFLRSDLTGQDRILKKKSLASLGICGFWAFSYIFLGEPTKRPNLVNFQGGGPKWMQLFFAYSWKLPAYSGASYVQLTILAFYLQLELFCLQWESASKKAKLNCKQRSPNCK